jgi:hypothetical protein
MGGVCGYYLRVRKPAEISIVEEKIWLLAQRMSPMN